MTMQLIVCVQLLPEDVKVFDGKIHIRLQTIVNKDRNWKRRLGDKPNVADLMVFCTVWNVYKEALGGLVVDEFRAIVTPTVNTGFTM